MHLRVSNRHAEWWRGGNIILRCVSNRYFCFGCDADRSFPREIRSRGFRRIFHLLYARRRRFLKKEMKKTKNRKVKPSNRVVGERKLLQWYYYGYNIMYANTEHIGKRRPTFALSTATTSYPLFLRETCFRRGTNRPGIEKRKCLRTYYIFHRTLCPRSCTAAGRPTEIIIIFVNRTT